MADVKITDLPLQADATNDDLLVVVNNPGGAPVTGKVSVGALRAGGGLTSTGVLNVTPTSIPVQPVHPIFPAALNVVGFPGQTEASDLIIAVTGNQQGFARINWDATVQIAADADYAINLLEVGDSVDNVMVVSAASYTAVAIQCREDNQTGLDIRGVTGLTEPLVYLATQGAGIFLIRPGGAIVFRATQPADSEISAGLCSLWFDSTNGASKLMVKGKSANGTVVTGQINLT